MNNRDAYIILNSLPDIGPLRVETLLRFFGEPTAILRTSERTLREVRGIGARTAEAIVNWQQHVDLDEEKRRVERAGVTLLTREDEDYPPLLREIHDPPICLYVRGAPEVLARTRSSVSMVGSRRVTNYGRKMADNLGSAAGAAGWPVVSGLARGIDTVVHEAVVRMGGTAIAVLGSGLGRLYPQENIALARRITENGVVISEFPMDFGPVKRSFPMRNRIIAGIALGTIVIEAGHRSGSLITATQALDQNRQVFAVPGRADSPQSRGCNQLLREGAVLTESFQDVLEALSFLPGFRNAQPAAAPEESKDAAAEKNLPPDLTLSEIESKLLDSIDNDEVHIDSLVATTNEPVPAVLQALFTLELKRIIRQLPGKRVVRVADA